MAGVGNAKRHDGRVGQVRLRRKQWAGDAQQLGALALAGAQDEVGMSQLQRLDGYAGAQLAFTLAARGERRELLLVGVILVSDCHEAVQWSQRQQVRRQARGEDRVVAGGLAQEPPAA